MSEETPAARDALARRTSRPKPVVAPDNPPERWTIYRDDSGFIRARGSDLLNGPRFAEGVEVCPVSELEVALQERDEAKLAAIKRDSELRGELVMVVWAREKEVAELKRRLEEKDE